MATTVGAGLKSEVERARQEIAAQASKTRSRSLIGLVLGLFVLGGLFGYFYYGYAMFSDVLRPDHVADTAATFVSDNLPTFRKTLETEVQKSAPGWAQTLSKQLRDGVPTGREKLEERLIDRSKTMLDQGAVLTHEHFEAFLRQNKHLLRREASELAKDPKAADQAVADLEKALTVEIGADLKSQANELLYVLIAFNDKLSKLAKNQNLDATELIERRLAMIARKVQSTKVSLADMNKKDVPPAPSIGNAVPSGAVPTDATGVRRGVQRDPSVKDDRAAKLDDASKPGVDGKAPSAPVEGAKPDESKKPADPKI